MIRSKRLFSLIVLAIICSVCLMPVQPSYAATVTTSYSSAANVPQYAVIQGDTLYKIGLLFKTTSTVLIQTNNLQSTMIYPGQKLTVPAATHTVKAGDTLYLISVKYGISLYSLRRANNMWTDMIYPGRVLLLPGKSPATAPAPAPAPGSTSAPVPTPAPTPVPAGTAYVVPCTTAEFDLLARLVTAEAAGEPYEAQVAVAAVVINRVQSKEWPNTITSVINHVAGGYYQFTPVENGFINRPATELSKKAAKEALYGRDPSKGAIFYFDDSATNKWLWARPSAITISHMVFKY